MVAKANVVAMRQPKILMVHLQAKNKEAKMGNKAEAMATAKKSMELAKALVTWIYVSLNEKLLKACKYASITSKMASKE